MFDKSYVRLKDKDGNLQKEVLKAEYDDDTETFTVHLNDKSCVVLGWDDLEECHEDGTLFEHIPDDAIFHLSPLSCFAMALGDSHIIDDTWKEVYDKNFRNAYMVLEEWFRDNGYIIDDSGNTKECDNPEKPKYLFCKVVNVFYPDSTADQRDVAWEMFEYHMKFQGYMLLKKR
jgi:hypothetical protein